jgi:hypothetical protein
MNTMLVAHLKSVQANAVELALPGYWRCPLEGEMAAGHFGGEF